MNIDDKLHGFTLVNQENIPETGGEALYFEHELSGARLLYLKNEDDNKVFGVGFRTPSNNSTGVAHILEHSVLNGSRKYRTKEPFMDMAKTSLATFLNAMTFSDKTIYPVASRHDKDFDHLMDLYLDAVFFPGIYNNKEVFLQEGWHYHLEKPEDELSYRGVVYNEMRGALSAADDQVHNAFMNALYPDTIYGKESGGDPYDIPQLSYEAFLDYHRTYYHPSNSYLYLYGKMDIERIFAHINDEYLSQFKRQPIESALTEQAPFKEMKRVTAKYSIGKDDETKNKDHLIYGVLFGKRTSLYDLYLSELLLDALVESQAAPLRMALLEAGIGADVGSLSSDGLQIPFAVSAKDTDAKRMDEFVEVVESTLHKLVQEGIEKDLLLSSLNRLEFRYREASGYATRGIVYYINAFESWLYDEHPFKALAYDKPLHDLRQAILTGQIEKEIQTRILDNAHKVIMIAEPQAGYNEDRDQEVAQQLAQYKESLSAEELAQLIHETEALIKRQNSQDGPAERATLPLLSLDEIEAKVVKPQNRTMTVAGNEVFLTSIFTSGILYVDLYFKTEHIAAEDISDYALLCALLGSMDTENYAYHELNTQVYLKTGGISINAEVHQHYQDKSILLPRLSVASKLLSSDYYDDFFSLLNEELFHTTFINRKRLYEIIQMMRSRFEMGVFSQGHRVAVARASSYFSAQAKYGEALAGMDFLAYIQNLDKHFDEQYEDLVKRLSKLYAQLVDRHGVVVGITACEEDAMAFLPKLEKFLQNLPAEERRPKVFVPEVSVGNEGIQSAAGVQYVAQAADYHQYGHVYQGEMEVLANILSNEYLYNEIRAKGGAYGQGVRFMHNGTMSLYSYRDPNLKETFEVFKNLPNWLANLELDEEALLPYIIGTLNHFNPAVTARTLGRIGVYMHMIGENYDDMEKNLQQALATNVDQLRAYAPMIEKVIEENMICVLGSASKIKENENLFDKIIRLDG